MADRFKILKVVAVCILFLSSSAGQTPEPGGGTVIFQHDFSDGMPSEFNDSASYPNSGTWGRAHSISGGGVYDPASISNGRLRMVGPSCSYQGVAYPVTVDKDVTDWELSYRVDARPGSTGHGDRITGGIMGVGAEPQGNYNDDRSELNSGRSGFWDYGSTYRIRGLNGAGDVVSRSVSTSIGDIRNGKWNVRIATSQEETTTWVKYWQQGNSEPQDWTHTFENTYLDGRPGFEAYGTCKGSSRYNFYDYYELREIGFEGEFCNRRGPANQCIIDQENFISSPNVDISEAFKSLHNASIEADGTNFNMASRTEISGFWKGSMNINAENPVIKAGAVFRPTGTINIGN